MLVVHRLTVFSRVAGGEERSRRVRLAGRPAERKRGLGQVGAGTERESHIWEDAAIVTLRWAWLRNASGYIFMTGKV